MRLLVTILQLIAAIPLLLGALLIFVGLFADDMLGEMATFMDVPITLAGAVLLLVGIGMAALVRRLAGAGAMVLDLRRFRRPPGGSA